MTPSRGPHDERTRRTPFCVAFFRARSLGFWLSCAFSMVEPGPWRCLAARNGDLDPLDNNSIL